MGIGYRPRGESGPLYHPDRDYAYITPTLMRAAIERLASDQISDEAKAWKKEHNITDAEINELADALARAQRDFINGADPVATFEHALNRRDWFDIRYPVRQFLFAVIGEVFCAAWFTAVREVTRQNEESPAAPHMADFIAAVRAFVGLPNADDLLYTRVASAQLRNDVLQSRLQTVYARVQELEEYLRKLELEKQAPAAEPATEKKKSAGWLASFFGGLTNRTGPK